MSANGCFMPLSHASVGPEEPSWPVEVVCSHWPGKVGRGRSLHGLEDSQLHAYLASPRMGLVTATPDFPGLLQWGQSPCRTRAHGSQWAAPNVVQLRPGSSYTSVPS